MPEFHWRLPALISNLEDESFLARPLLLPGVSCYALTTRKLREMLSHRVKDVIKQLPSGDIYRYLFADLPDIRTTSLEVPPLREDQLRAHPVVLPVQYVVWRHGTDALIAYVPALDIEILARDESQLEELLQPQMKMALSRNGWNRSLRHLVALARFRDLKVRHLPLKLKLPTLKEAAKEQENQIQQEKSILKEVASNLVTQASDPVYERDAEVERLAKLLTRRSPRSVLLVGPSGVGKSALVQHLARRRESLGPGRATLWSTSGSRIVAGMTGFGMWQERCEKLVREAEKAKAILHLGNLVELIEVGKGGGNLQGVAALLRPHLDRGAFLAIAECTPEQLAVVERENPQFLETFAQFEVSSTSPEQTLAILHAVVWDHARLRLRVKRDTVARERNAGPRISADGLAVMDRLHRRWATYSSAPGRQLRFLRNLLDDRARRRIPSDRSEHRRRREIEQEISSREVTAAFSQETGLPLFMLEDALPLDLTHTYQWFTQRVMGQNDAVRQMVDVLAAVKTGLARGGKPIASLLLIGPTGVGKTEMAKSLAEFLYQDRGRLIRFDMSEYSHPAAIERLIGGAYSAQGLLTQRVRDQPFTVVLLDEFEKAHPQFFDVLLQVLGEGRLTDGVGRVTDFTNSVVIMTSNLGAESYRRGAFGFAGQEAATHFAERHFEREVKSFLRPEMFNRLDRIIHFAPLDRSTIASIARRELEHVLARDGLRFREVQLSIEDSATEHLIESGFDSRYGARPLKRTIERQLVAPLAEGLNRYASNMNVVCRAHTSGDQLRVEINARPGSSSNQPRGSATAAIELVVALRRHVQAMQQSGILTRLRNEIERIRLEHETRERKLKKRGQKSRYTLTPEQARVLGHEKLLQRIDTLAREVNALEDDCLGRLYAGEVIEPAEIETCWSDFDRTLRQLLFELALTDSNRRSQLTIAAFGESLHCVIELMSMYREICSANRAATKWFWLKMYREEYDEARNGGSNFVQLPAGKRPIMRLLSRPQNESKAQHKVIDVYDAAPEPFEAAPEDCIGIAVHIAGERSVALLQTESGRHEFLRVGGGREVCLVETVSKPLIDYDPPLNVGRRGAMNDLRLRRTYDLREEEIRDELLHKAVPIRARRINEAFVKAVEEYLTVRLWELIEAWS